MTNKLWLSGISIEKKESATEEKDITIRDDQLHIGAGGRAYSKPSEPMPENIRLRNETEASLRKSIEERISNMRKAGDKTGAEELRASVEDADEWDYEVL